MKRNVSNTIKRYTTDNSYKRDVLNKAGTAAGESAVKGILSTASKVGTGALATYAISQLTKKKDDDDQK
jgi:hypothetical protein